MYDLIVIFCAKYLIYLAALALGAYWLLAPREIKVELALGGVIALPAAYALARLAGLFFSHEQPFAAQGFEPLVAHGVDNSFPSDHATATATLAGIAFAYNRSLGMLLMLLALATGVARVAAGLHYPIDVAAGYLIGLASASIIYFCVHAYFRARAHTAQ